MVKLEKVDVRNYQIVTFSLFTSYFSVLVPQTTSKGVPKETIESEAEDNN